MSGANGTGITRRAFVAVSAAVGGSAAAAAQGRQRYLLLTGAAGGAFNEYGPALAAVAATHGPVDLDVRSSAGSNENIRAVDRGEADLALANLGPAFEAWHGRPPFAESGPHQAIRALFPMYETPFSFIALRASGISTLSGLENKVVGVGPSGGAGQVFFSGLTRALGLGVTVATGSPSDLARRLLAGEVDAFWFGAGVPVSAYVEILDKADAVVFGLSAPEVATFRRAFTYLAPYAIPAGSYKGQTAPIATAAVWNFVVGSDRLPEEAGYGLTKAALEHTAELAAALPAAAATAIGNVAANAFMPFHPGAARYYRERGLSLPAALMPP